MSSSDVPWFGFFHFHCCATFNPVSISLGFQMCTQSTSTFLITKLIGSNPNISLNSAFFFLSCELNPHPSHHAQPISVVSSYTSCSIFIGHAGLAPFQTGPCTRCFNENPLTVSTAEHDNYQNYEQSVAVLQLNA